MLSRSSRIWGITVLLAMCCVQVSVWGQAVLDRPETIALDEFEFVDDVLEKDIESGKLVGAVTWIAQGGKVVHLEAHGLRDRESNSAMQTDSIFRIYSFTKSITTAAAMMLWEEGKFKLDDPVAKFLPEFANQLVYDPAGNRPPTRPMTVRDLMCHTSGVIYPNKDGNAVEQIWDKANLRDRDASLEEFAQRVAGVPLEFSPGEQWKYGMSIDVLGRLIEVWSGESFEGFLRARVFEPLEMSDTDFFVPESKLERLATLYERSGEGELEPRYGKDKKDQFYVPTSSPIHCSGGGGLYSTASDYGTFLQTFLAGGQHKGHQLLKASTVELMTSDRLPSNVPGVRFGNESRDGFKFGLGFNVIAKPGKWDPQARVREFGWGGAASCHYWLWPPKKLAVITLEATWPYNRNLEDALKGKVYEALD